MTARNGSFDVEIIKFIVPDPGCILLAFVWSSSKFLMDLAIDKFTRCKFEIAPW